MTFIDVEGCRNFRDVGPIDLGGGRVLGAGNVFRSSRPSHATETGIRTIAGLGIRTRIDLRGEVELAPHDPTLLGPDVRYVNVPMLPPQAPAGSDPLIGEDGIRNRQYTWIARYAREPLREIFRVLTDPRSYPVLVHCAHGWGRTGIVIALLLDAAGASPDAIADEYVRTQLALDALTPAERELPPWQWVQAAFIEGVGQPVASMSAYRESALGFLATIADEWGTPRAFLVEACRVPEADLDRIATFLAEPSPAA